VLNQEFADRGRSSFLDAIESIHLHAKMSAAQSEYRSSSVEHHEIHLKELEQHG